MPALAFELFLAASDEFAWPAGGKLATFWLDPHGFMLEAVCHHDRD